MSVREVASAEFYQVSRRTAGKLLVAQFTATWCGPCRRVAPQLEALAQRTPDVEFVKVYEHTCRDVIMSSGVRSFPTFHFYVGGEKIDECRGANIRAVEQKVAQHKGTASAPAGPVVVKLRFERQKRREGGDGFVLVSEEVELEVHASEGLEIFKFQVLSITDIETNDQALVTGDSNIPIDSDASLAAGLRRTGGGLYGNYPVISVTKRAASARKARQDGVSARSATATGAVDVPAWDGCCSRTFFGTRPVVQPAYVVREESLLPEAELTQLQKKKCGPEAILVVCGQCAENCFIPGRAEHCSAISESAAFVCQSKEACAKGHGTDLFSERADAGTEVYEPGSPAAISAEAAAVAAADRVYYAARGLSSAGGENDDMVAMRRRISNGSSHVLAYEDPGLQAQARAVLPTEGGGGSIAQRGAEMAAEGGYSEEEGLARALLSWFKKDFFKWMNKPPCSVCGARGASMEIRAQGRPTLEESAGGASRVEVYQCKKCLAETRFPRYNSPSKLLETRTGRCGEWANCFTLMCRAVGLEARHVHDWTDHVWTEVWIPARNKWVHADPCENKLNMPLMYEQGWNKRLSYVIASDRTGVVDVTRRYTRRWLQVLSRRNLVPEKWLAGVIADAGSSRSEARTALIATRLAEEQRELKDYESASYDSDVLDSEEKEGRQSGDAEWIASRGEGTGRSASVDRGPDAKHFQATSPLLGVPLGVVQPGGALALCVAAVVEGAEDAHIVVGGATVCRSSRKGRGGLCAAAVSAATGVLLGARTFWLGRDDNSSSAATGGLSDWLAALPEGIVVAVAACGGATAAASLETGLTDALDKLVHGGNSNSEGSSPLEDGKSAGWTLVGWKGSGVQHWARRQNGSAASSKRCAVYAELLLPPTPPSADNASGTGPKTTQVELKDKLCLCPLQSVQARTAATPTVPVDTPSLPGATSPTTDGIRFPARGTCYRQGEPTVSVGPTLDLVNCPGWTTVLQAPEDGGETNTAEIDEERASTTLWRTTTVLPAVGGWHGDTKAFDDSPVWCPAAVMGGSPIALPGGTPFLPAGRVREIIGWGGDHLNGVQVLYELEGETIRGTAHMGDHGLYRQSRMVLDVDGGEVVTEVSVKVGSLVDSLHVRTSKGQEKKWGGGGGELKQTWRVSSGDSFVGFHGGLGGHMHSLGVILAAEGGRAPGRPLSEEHDSPFSSSPVMAALYSKDPVSRACAQLLAFNATSREKRGGEGCSSPSALSQPKSTPLASDEVITALETARKYADNLLASPLNPRVSQIRLANGYFDRKIGRIPGGSGVIRAMGFEVTDEEGQMHFVFRRQGPGGGLAGIKRARQVLTDFLAALKASSA